MDLKILNFAVILRLLNICFQMSYNINLQSKNCLSLFPRKMLFQKFLQNIPLLRGVRGGSESIKLLSLKAMVSTKFQAEAVNENKIIEEIS